VSAAHLAGRGLVASALARAEAFLLAPPERDDGQGIPAPPQRRLVIAVFGLGRRCGTTTVARALGAELAARDPSGSAAVASALPAAGLPLAYPAATRLARSLADVPRARTRAVGRLCLVEGPDPLALADTARELAPLVLDAGNAHLGGAAAAIADQVAIVAAPAIEPSLADVAAACAARVGPSPLIVLNRADGDPRWEGRAGLELPHSLLGARLAHGGREPRGALGEAIAALADRCAQER
jgi:hypothetical protein